MGITLPIFEINLYAATAAVFVAGIWLVTWWRLRYAYMLLLALGWLVLCVYWGLITVSAGPQPPITLDQARPFIRVALFVGITLLVFGKLALLRIAWQMRARVEDGE